MAEQVILDLRGIVKFLHTSYLTPTYFYLMLGTDFSILKLVEDTCALAKLLPDITCVFSAARVLSAMRIGRVRRSNNIMHPT